MNWVNFSVVNIITFIRFLGIIALIPVFNIYGSIATFFLCAICFLTDWFDGMLARKLNCSTFFGSIFDSISDKLFLIANMVLLYKITKLAIIPIIFEITIILIQSIKYSKGYNIKANIYGKVKMWIAGLAITFSYLISKDIIYILLIPFIISEIITVISYILEVEKRNNNDESEIAKIKESLKNITIKEFLFNPIYYKEYKDYGNMKMIYNLINR